MHGIASEVITLTDDTSNSNLLLLEDIGSNPASVICFLITVTVSFEPPVATSVHSPSSRCVV